ncbi:hypothetical protein D3C81_103480 [compost metagenome]
MSKLHSTHPTFIRNACLVLALSWLSGCVMLPSVSQYDEVTDKQLTALQQSTDDFIVKLATETNPKARTYQANQTFYVDTDKQLRHLEFRVDSVPDNTQTITLVKDIRTLILGSGQCSPEGTSLKDLHCMPSNQIKGPSAQSLVAIQRQINIAISAALKHEIYKKQADTPEK